MTTDEFSSSFDILYNNVLSNQAPPVNEYEKSVFLTKAQYEIINNNFNPKGNKYNEGFDDSIKRQTDFANIIVTAICTSNTDTSVQLNTASQKYILPTDLMFILNETIVLGTSGKMLQVVPISQLEYSALMRRPFKEPLKNEAWRLITNNVTAGVSVELIVHTGDTIATYKVRYVKRPTPIITADISSYNRTIDGLSAKTECILNASLHEEILQRAVELGKVAYEGDTNVAIQTGERSE